MASTKRTTSPAFQYYPSDFLSDDKVCRMSYTEIGIYWVLLSHSWLGHGLPTDVAEVAKILKLPTARWRKIWAGVISECFVERGGRLVNLRQEHERRKQAEFRQRQTDKANTRWQASGNATALPARHGSGNALQSSSSISSSKKEQKISPEPLRDSGPKFLTFPTVGHPPFWDLVDEQVARWRELYPNVDVTTECMKALGWIESNPQKRKTAKGMGAFLVNWLNRAVNGGTGTQSVRPVAGSRTAGNESELKAFANRGRTA